MRGKSKLEKQDVLKKCPVCNRLLTVKEPKCKACGWNGLFDRDPVRLSRAVDFVFKEDKPQTS